MMTRTKLPWVFRIAAALLFAAVAFGGWWQQRPVGRAGRTFLAAAARACPAAAVRALRPTVADTARALDRAAYFMTADLLRRDGPSRCAAGASR